MTKLESYDDSPKAHLINVLIFLLMEILHFYLHATLYCMVDLLILKQVIFSSIYLEANRAGSNCIRQAEQ